MMKKFIRWKLFRATLCSFFKSFFQNIKLSVRIVIGEKMLTIAYFNLYKKDIKITLEFFYCCLYGCFVELGRGLVVTLGLLYAT